jgi:hypothetical protein
MIAPKGSTLTLTLPSDREISLTRELDATRELVFKAFSRRRVRPAAVVVTLLEWRAGESSLWISA